MSSFVLVTLKGAGEILPYIVYGFFYDPVIVF